MKKIVLASCIALAAMAEDTPLVTHAEFGYLNTKGNTNTTSLSFDGNAKKAWDANQFRLHADMYKSTDSGKTSKDKWSVELNYDRLLDETYSFNYVIGYKEDQFSGFDYQFYTGPGMNAKLINTTEHKLGIYGNILYAVDKPVVGDAYDYIGARVGGLYQWQIRDNLKFIQDLGYRTSLEDLDQFFINSKTAIEAKISDNFSMGIAYKIDYVNTPPAGFKDTDTALLASLIMDF